MRNPLTEVTGPEFLAIFAVIISIAAIVCWWRKWSRDTSAQLAPLSPPAEIDPYEVSYFRGGDSELARVIIVRLIERKYLRITTTSPGTFSKPSIRLIEQNPKPPSLSDLLPIELVAFEWFRSARTAEAVYARPDSSVSSTNLPFALRYHALKYEQNLRAERLLTSEQLKNEAWKNLAVGIAVVFAIGLVRSEMLTDDVEVPRKVFG